MSDPRDSSIVAETLRVDHDRESGQQHLPRVLGLFDATMMVVGSIIGSGIFLKALGIAMIAVLWPYDGWINVAPVAENIRDPKRNLPRAMIFGLGLVIAVYLGANLSYHLVLPIHHLANSSTVAADVFQKMFGPTGNQIAAIGVMVSTFGAANSNMITGPRIYLAVARDGLVPEWLQRIHPRYLTPANAIFIQAVWAVSLVLLFSAWEPNANSAVASTGSGSVQASSLFSSSAEHSRRLKNAFDGLRIL